MINESLEELKSQLNKKLLLFRYQPADLKNDEEMIFKITLNKEKLNLQIFNHFMNL